MSLLEGDSLVDASLPREFSELERFMDQWALPTQSERESRRRNTTPQQRKEFYEAVTPSLEAIIAWLDRFPLDAMPAAAQRLLLLILSLAEIAPTVELYKGSATVPYSFDETRFIAVHGDRRD
jgi:hypothetical protein